MPWMVTFFGILGVRFGSTPCLVAAVAMLIMIALTVPQGAPQAERVVSAKATVWGVAMP
jgi:hypothetical protein